MAEPGDEALTEVVSLELALLQPATRADREAVERLLHEDFREVGASGRIWEREAIVAALVADPGEQPVEPADIVARAVAAGVVLVTYSTGDSLRSSLWVREADCWRVLYHQGTPVAG